jgi:hypothetical protein
MVMGVHPAEMHPAAASLLGKQKQKLSQPPPPKLACVYRGPTSGDAATRRVPPVTPRWGLYKLNPVDP